MISSEILKQVVAEARPVLERQYADRRILNNIFMRAWREGALDEVWSEYRRHDDNGLWLTYFIRARGMGDIKIGKSNQVRTRVRTLFSCASRGVDLVACYPALISHEKELHSDFQHLRLCGEWFRPGDELLGHLKMIGCDVASFSNVVPASFYHRFPERLQ